VLRTTTADNDTSTVATRVQPTSAGSKLTGFAYRRQLRYRSRIRYRWGFVRVQRRRLSPNCSAAALWVQESGNEPETALRRATIMGFCCFSNRSSAWVTLKHRPLSNVRSILKVLASLQYFFSNLIYVVRLLKRQRSHKNDAKLPKRISFKINTVSIYTYRLFNKNRSMKRTRHCNHQVQGLRPPRLCTLPTFAALVL